MHLAMGIGVLTCVTGLTVTYVVSASPGATIVVLLVCLYALTALVSAAREAAGRRRGRRTDMLDAVTTGQQEVSS